MRTSYVELEAIGQEINGTRFATHGIALEWEADILRLVDRHSVQRVVETIDGGHAALYDEK